jgi:hypothetical protein
VTAKARTALSRLGVTDDQFNDLADGKPIAFALPNSAEGTIAVAHLPGTGRLRIGIYTLRSLGRGLGTLMSFEARARAAAEALGVKELEFLGIEVTNPRLDAALRLGGFLPATFPAPEELGGGTFEALSRIEPVE